MSDLEFEVAFRGAGKVYAPTTIEIDEEEVAAGRGHEPPNTCRILQRKLELKVERARRNYTQFQEEQVRVAAPPGSETSTLKSNDVYFYRLQRHSRPL